MKREVVMRWIEKAEEDMKTAECLLKVEDAPLSPVGFHCQQAIERYLKAFLTEYEVRAGKTHDLEVLLNLCIQKDKDFEIFDRDKISRLSFFAVEIWYPEEVYLPTREEIEDSLRFALKMKEFILKKLGIEEGKL